MKLRIFLVTMLFALIMCINPAVFAEDELDLFAMTGGIEFVDFALYDADGATHAGLISNSEMSVEVLVQNTKLTSRNYCVFAAVYTDDGTMYDVDFESGKFDGNAPIDFVYGTEWIKKVNLEINIPEVTDKTELKVMLFESPKLLNPSGDLYYMADKNSVYMHSKGMKVDIERSDDLVLWEGIVTKVPYTEYAENGYDSDITPEIIIEGFYTYKENGKTYKEYDHIVADCSLVDANNLLGKKVYAYIGESEDSKTGNIMVYGICEKPSSETVTINVSQLVSEEDFEWDIEDQISYRLPGSSKVYDLDIDRDAYFYINYMETHPLNTTRSLYEEIFYDYYGGTIEFINNDSDSSIDVVLVHAYDDESVVKKVTEEDGLYSFTLFNNGELDEIDTADEDFYYEIYKNGVKSDVTAIAPGDTINCVSLDRDAVIYYASSASKFGSISSYDDYTVTIDNTDYCISAFYGKIPRDFRDAYGTFYINVFGDIAWYELYEENNYGMILGISYTGGISDFYLMKVVTADGNVADYKLASKAKVYDKERNIITTDDDTTAEYIAGLISSSYDLSSGNALLEVGKAVNSVYNFEFKNNEITKVKVLRGESYDGYLSDNSRYYNEETMSYGVTEFNADTVIFALDKEYSNSADLIKQQNVTVGKVSDFFKAGDENLSFIALDEKDYIFQTVVGFGFNKETE